MLALLVLWTSFPILTLFTVLTDGMPQPGDMVMAVAAAAVLTGTVVRLPQQAELYVLGCAFVAYVVVVNLVWWLIVGDPYFVQSAMFYTYNFAIVVSCTALLKARGDHFLTLLRASLVASVAIELIAVLIGVGGGSFRSTGTFGNPNQLGYWALLAMACWLVARPDRPLRAVDIAVIASLIYIVLLSVSKAAVVGVLMQSVLAVWHQKLRATLAFVAIYLFMSLSVLAMLEPQMVAEKLALAAEGDLIGKTLQRFAADEGDDSVSGRGFDRLLQLPHHLFVGAGEGAYHRFGIPGRTVIDDLELHSSWGTLLMSYGVVGFALFCGMAWTIFRGAPLRHFMYFVPIFLYGLTHQGLRESLLWVFFGLVYGLAHHRRSHRGEAEATAQRDSLRRRARGGAAHSEAST